MRLDLFLRATLAAALAFGFVLSYESEMQPVNAQGLSTFAVGSDAPEIQFETASKGNISLPALLSNKRIVLIFAPDEDTDRVNGYLQHLAGLEKQLVDRDLQVIVLADQKSVLQEKDFGKCISIAIKSNVMPTASSANLDHSLLFVLIGKDKTVKLREQKLVQDKSLFAVIDAMPQRRAEVKSKK